MPLNAITRAVSPSLNDCQVAFVQRRPIDVAKAIIQHDRYEAALRSLGIGVVSLPPLPGLPDAVFVEDPVIVLDEVAMITRMGAESRRGEAASLAEAVARPGRHDGLGGRGVFVVDGIPWRGSGRASGCQR
jgi:dimethylargininase